MANRRASGGLIGKSNKTSGGGNTVTRLNASGTFQVQPNTNIVDVLTVAGGGGGGGSLQNPPFVTPTADAGAAGGGAGGFRNFTSQEVVAGSQISVTVGAGGAGEEANLGGQGTPGGNSVFSNPLNPISTTGGGGGGGWNRSPWSSFIGLPGGSGGGGGTYGPCCASPTPGAGNAGSYDPVEGYAGGFGGGYRGGAGGGGASAVGINRMGPGHGGEGETSSVTGTATYYAGGGGGGSRAPDQKVGLGGLGGGGRGGGGQFGGCFAPGYHPKQTGVTGSTNTGGGGGGGGSGSGGIPVFGGKGGSGGSGVVIVKELDKAGGMFDMKSHFTAHTKGQWPTRGSGDEISNSLMIENGDTSYISRSMAGVEASGTTFTWSGWYKGINTESGDHYLFSYSNVNNSYTDHCHVRRDGNKKLQCQFYTDSSSRGQIVDNAVLRDPSAWYHVVFRFDTTDDVANNRIRMYVNGSEISYGTQTMPAQNLSLLPEESIFRTSSYASTGGRFHGYLSEVNFIDGQSLSPNYFGEPDPDCPQIWRHKKYYGTYGSGGFHLEFKQSGVGSGSASTLGADTSGNNNHLDTTNVAATDQSIDTPTNNFCTMNPLDQGTITLSEGNTKIVCDGSNNDGCKGTIGFPASGKWYFEYYLSAHAGGDAPQIMGIGQGGASNDTWVASGNYIVYEIDSGNKRINQSSSSYGATATTGDTIGVAVNMDDNEVIFYKNGSTQGTISNAIITDSDHYLPYIMDGSSVRSHVTYANFGNPSFSISSGNADANGYGNFEHAVPSGHYALCTKNLAQYG